MRALNKLAFTLIFGTGLVSGQDYPNKPIRIVTSGAGGGSDFTTRLVAPGVSAALGQQVIVDNRNSAVQGDLVAKAPPDGYTVLIAGGTFMTIPLLQKMTYDPLRDFVAVVYIDRSASVLAVHPSLPVRTVKELIALAKAKPGQLNYSSSGRGSNPQLALELFKSMAGINVVHVPYNGGSQAITGLVSGEVQLTIFDAGAMLALAKAGRLRAIAVTTPEPTPLAPGLPTVASSGLAGFESVGVTGMFAPAKTPDAIIKRLNEAVIRHINTPDAKETFFRAGSDVMGGTPEQFAAVVKRDIERSAKLIRDLGIRID